MQVSGERTTSLLGALTAPYAPADEARRYVLLDGLRFFAALGIVFVHCNLFVSGYGWAKGLPFLPSFNLWVDFFFVLSGFVIEMGYGARMRIVADYGRFLRARFARIYPLHALTLAACIPMTFYAAGGGHFRAVWGWLDISFAPLNLLLLQAFDTLPGPSLNVAAWSISAEAAMYLAFPLTLLMLRRLRAAGVIAAAIAFFAAVVALREQAWTLATYDWGVLRAIPAFLIGAAISTTLRRLDAPRIGVGHALAFVACVVVAMLVDAPSMLIAAMLPFCVALPALAERNADFSIAGSRKLGFLGDLSYGVYMLHIPVLYLLTDALDGAAVSNGAKALATFALVPAISIALAIPVYRWFEAPMRAWISGRRVAPAMAMPPVAATPALEGR